MDEEQQEINIKFTLIGLVFVLIVLHVLKTEFEIPYYLAIIIYLYIQAGIFLFCKKNIELKAAGIVLVPFVILQMLMPFEMSTKIANINTKIT